MEFAANASALVIALIVGWRTAVSSPNEDWGSPYAQTRRFLAFTGVFFLIDSVRNWPPIVWQALFSLILLGISWPASGSKVIAWFPRTGAAVWSYSETRFPRLSRFAKSQWTSDRLIYAACVVLAAQMLFKHLRH